jgi:hypothetical protein
VFAITNPSNNYFSAQWSDVSSSPSFTYIKTKVDVVVVRAAVAIIIITIMRQHRSRHRSTISAVVWALTTAKIDPFWSPQQGHARSEYVAVERAIKSGPKRFSSRSPIWLCWSRGSISGVSFVAQVQDIAL